MEVFKTHAPICELHVGGRVVRTMHGHPFWVKGKGWTTAMDLRPGQELRTEDGWVPCDAVVDNHESADVYNFEVADGHSYFVGDPVTWGFALWNHNAGVDCAGVAAKIHKNSYQYVGPTHVYRIVGPNGTYKIGKSAGPIVNGLSARAESQIRQLASATGQRFESEIINDALGGTQAARQFETALIQRFKSLFGADALPGNRVSW